MTALKVVPAEMALAANAVLFLCSDAAGFITGAELAVDGGWGVKATL